MAWLLTWLVHGLAIALVTRFALRVLPGVSAATRYAMWWAALVLVLILPIIRGMAIRAGAGAGAGPVSPERAIDVVDNVAGVAADAGAPAGSTGFAGSVDSAAYVSPRMLVAVVPVAVAPVSLPRVPDWFLSIVIGLWLGCAMVGLAQLAYSVQAVRRLKASCRRLVTPREADLPMWSAVKDRGRAVRVRASDHVRTAAVLGLTRPVVAVPRDAAEALTPHEIDQIVLHEYAHVQRYDDWTKLLQVLIGAFAGWHPAVRLMMREIDFEREAACDDYVVDITGAPRAYARCLTKVIEMMPGSSLDLAAVPHAYSSASQATTRIERLLDRKRPSGRLKLMPAMAGSATLAVLAFCTVHALPIATDLPRAHGSNATTRDATVARAPIPGDAMVATARDVVDADGIDANARRENTPSTPPRGLDLRIAAASTLPLQLPFPRFSPLSRLTNAQPAASGAAPSVAATPEPGRPETSSTSSTRGFASEASPSTGLARADKPVDVNNAPAAPSGPAPTLETQHARETPAGHGGGGGVVTRRAARTDSLGDSRAAAPARLETTFALGPVVAAGDSAAMPEASDAGSIERAWENTRDATSKAMGVSARAVGSATKTAGDATKTATNKAAAGVKAGGTHTARAFGRAKRAIASVF